MQHTPLNETPAFTIQFRGMRVQCANVEQVVEAVRALSPLEREVSVPIASEARPIADVSASPIAVAVYDLFREEPRWRRPVEIVKALRKRHIGAKYTNVYAVLRYGDFVKREGRWNLRDDALSSF